MIQVAPGTIVIYADLGCPWAHLAVHRLHRARAELGSDDRVAFDIRPFPLELLNEQPTPRPTLDAETVAVGTLDPSAGWQVWQAEAHSYPVTTLPPMEAVEAAKEQGLRASEQLDRALRRAFFAQSRCISLRHVIRDVARDCSEVDVDKLLDALDEGRARPLLMEHARVAASDQVKGSPQVFLADGTGTHNPGIEMHWESEHGKGFPVIDSFRPETYVELIQRADADQEGRTWTRA